MILPVSLFLGLNDLHLSDTLGSTGSQSDTWVVRSDPSVRMESIVHLFDAQWPALDKLIALIEFDQIDQIMAQGPEVLNVRLEILMRYETMMIGQVYDNIALA